MTIQLSTERNIMALALAFTIGTACGLATSGTGIPISLRYLLAGISSIAAIAMTTWTKLAVSQCKLLLTYLTAGIFCATTCQLSSTGVQAIRTSTAAADFGSMIMSLPFRSDDAAALVNALVTGDKSWLSPEIIGTFRTSGASHILALSGLHLGIIYIILGYATSILGRSTAAKMTRSIIIVSLSGAYTIATGAAPSLVRAFLFILINETAHLLHRKSNPVHTFCAALMILFTLLQTTIFSSLRPFGAVPDMMLSAVIAIAVSEGEKWGAVCGLISSLLISSVGTTGFSVIPLVYMLTGYITGLLSRYYLRQNAVIRLIYQLCAGFLRAAATLMMLHAHMAHFTFTEVLTGTLLPEYFSTLAVSPLVQAVVWISLKAFHRTRAERTDTPSDL